jgi:acyl carrier protein
VLISRSTRAALTSGGRALETLKGELRLLLTELASLPEGFDENADLYSDLGMTSMKAMELLMALEERYGVRVPDEEFIEATSLQRLAGMMRGLQN